MNNQFLAWYENLGFSGSSQSALLFPSFSDHFPTIFYSSFLLRELTKVLIFRVMSESFPLLFAAKKYTTSLTMDVIVQTGICLTSPAHPGDARSDPIFASQEEFEYAKGIILERRRLEQLDKACVK